MAREHGPLGYRSGPPEEPYYEVRPEPPLRTRMLRTAAVVGVGAAAALATGVLATRATRR